MKIYESLSKSPLVIKLIESGTGVIEGNFRSMLTPFAMKNDFGHICFSIHLSDYNGNYLGQYFLSHHEPRDRFDDCEVLVSEDGPVYFPSDKCPDNSIVISLFPFSPINPQVGRFTADFGGLALQEELCLFQDITLESLFSKVADDSIRGNKVRTVSALKYIVRVYFEKIGQPLDYKTTIYLSHLIKYFNENGGFLQSTRKGHIRNYGEKCQALTCKVLEPYKEYIIGF